MALQMFIQMAVWVCNIYVLNCLAHLLPWHTEFAYYTVCAMSACMYVYMYM